jgi:hypothetical protein
MIYVGKCWKIPLVVLEHMKNFSVYVGKHLKIPVRDCNMLEMSAVSVGKHLRENSVMPAVWYWDNCHICRNLVSILVTVKYNFIKMRD